MSFFSVINCNKFKKFIINGLIVCCVLIVLCATIFSSGIKSVGSTKALEPIYRGNSEKNNVSLMINVYWGGEYIESMLKVLDENGAKATFFVGGSWVKNNKELFSKIVQGGHEIANHGYLHKDCVKISEAQLRDEIEKTNKIVKEFGGGDCALFAPPSGSFDQKTLKVVQELGMKSIMWSKDTIDWRDKSTSIILQRATTSLQNGDLILMHPTQATSQVFGEIVKKIKEQNFVLTTVSENIK